MDIETEMIDTISKKISECIDKTIIESMLYPNRTIKRITFLDKRKQFPFQRVNITKYYDNNELIREECSEGFDYLVKYNNGKLDKYIKEYQEY